MLGARYAGADESTVAALQQYGLEVGVAFQITDDVLDLVGSQEQMGKTLGRDLAEKKLTLPVIHALAQADTARRSRIRDLAGRRTPERHLLAELLRQTGSIAFSTEMAAGYVSSAIERLEALRPGDSRTALKRLAGSILTRDL